MFPEYTILEWLPGGNTVLASFLLVRKVDPNTPFPIEPASETGGSRAKGKASKSKKGKNKDKGVDDDKGKEKGKQSDKDKDQTNEKGKGDGDAQSTAKQDAASASADGKQTPVEGTIAASEDANKKNQEKPDKPDSDKKTAKDKSEDAKKTDNLKEYYQPVTFRIHSTNPKVLEPLSRVVKPADEVRKYMNEIMDRAERAPDGFLAYRLPREEADEPEAEDSSSNTKKGGTPVPAGRSRLSKGRAVENEESEAENLEGAAEEEEEEEELKDYYGPPTGLVPMGA